MLFLLTFNSFYTKNDENRHRPTVLDTLEIEVGERKIQSLAWTSEQVQGQLGQIVSPYLKGLGLHNSLVELD